ncbi:MAG: hypothetical protein GXX85_12840 [Ignavibacteria bacterium]|nr:hypothetical protein [Ignavibacteria bacterium]
MKNLICILFSAILFSCSEDKKPLELFSPEAFAFSMEPGWELNASVRVKNFAQKKESEVYKVEIAYSVILKNTVGKKIKTISSGVLNDSAVEEFQDLPIEVQTELDSTVSYGNYNILFSVTDKYSNEKDTLIKPFILSAE